MKLHGFIPVKSSEITWSRHAISGHFVCPAHPCLSMIFSEKTVPTFPDHARAKGRPSFPAGKCVKSHRKRDLTEKSGWSQGKISPASQSLGPPRAMFGSSRPHFVAA